MAQKVRGGLLVRQLVCRLGDFPARPEADCFGHISGILFAQSGDESSDEAFSRLPLVASPLGVATRSFSCSFGHFLKPTVLDILYFDLHLRKWHSSTMALARAITKHTKRSGSHTVTDTPTREGSARYPAGSVNRKLISPPTELILTTNLNALNYPSVSPSKSSISSGNDSDFTTISRNFIDSAATTPDSSSVEASPIFNPNNSLSFFDTPHRSKTVAGTRPSSSHSSINVPAIPKRALSHSKKAHQELARSISALAGPTVARNSADIFATADPSSPFVKELAQINEVAEEFGLV